ncbi:MAG: hypothetical protein RL122_2663 [Pseudomonadota bacterium]|jgi:uncharacterized protein (TIGR02646 family)
MKKVNKLTETPDTLWQFQQENPFATWEHFRNESNGGYRQVKEQLTIDQRGLCAYCEIDLHDGAGKGLDDFRVEHFIPKKPHNPPPNHALEWQNLLATCCGGNVRDLAASARFTSPDHSCDVPKSNHNWSETILNPLDMPAFPRLFRFDEATGEMMVDEKSCPPDLQDKARETIRCLRLSAPRLQKLRLPVFEILNEQIQAFASSGMDMEEAVALLAEALLPEEIEVPLPAFFTSIRWYLGNAAEERLNTINYNG